MSVGVDVNNMGVDVDVNNMSVDVDVNNYLPLRSPRKSMRRYTSLVNKGVMPTLNSLSC